MLGWGLIGASTIAREHMLPAINAQPDSRVVAVLSSDPSRAQLYAADLGIQRVHATLPEMLADPEIDVVYISTTNDQHAPQTIAAAQAGKHVLCEKPLALNLEDARSMIEACQRAGVTLGTNHHLRNAVTHRTLRRLVADGTIGEPLAARVFHAVSLPAHLRGWRVQRPKAGGGVIFDITVHDTDTLRFILDDEVAEVTALSANQGLAGADLEDAVMGVMRFSGGTLAQFHDAFTIRHARTGLEVHGTDGSLYAIDVMTQAPTGVITLRRDGREATVDTGPHENLYERSVRQFNLAVQGRGQPAATGEDGLQSLAVALAVHRSAREGRTVTVSR